jgi:anti-sigma B factor antagonist
MFSEGTHRKCEMPGYGVLAGTGVLKITVEHHDDATLLHADGEIELATAARLAAALADCSGEILLDLRSVTFIDCAGVTVLVNATHRAAGGGGRLRIVPGRAVQRLSDILGLAGELHLEDELSLRRRRARPPADG